MAGKRPDELTIEMVIGEYGDLIRKTIRDFRVQMDEDDCYAEILAALISPSKKWGTNYLQRYNPDVACASTYLTRLAINYMRGVYRKERKGMGKVNVTAVSLESSVGSGRQPAMRLSDTLADPSSEEVGGESERRLLQAALMKRLHSKRNREFYSKSSKGVKRSTFRMCMMMMLGDMDVVSISRELEVTPAEVRRRFKLLAKDPEIRRMAVDGGWKLGAA